MIDLRTTDPLRVACAMDRWAFSRRVRGKRIKQFIRAAVPGEFDYPAEGAIPTVPMPFFVLVEPIDGDPDCGVRLRRPCGLVHHDGTFYVSVGCGCVGTVPTPDHLKATIIPHPDAWCPTHRHEWLVSYRGTPEQREAYRAYLDSANWHGRRACVLEDADDRCALCNRTATNVHHRTYENIGAEPLNDLIALCRACHAKFHNKPVDE